MIRVSKHALKRYRERVEVVADDVIERRILSHSRAIECAMRFGALVVRNGDGVGFVIQDGVIATVLGPGMRLGPVE